MYINLELKNIHFKEYSIFSIIFLFCTQNSLHMVVETIFITMWNLNNVYTGCFVWFAPSKYVYKINITNN